MSGKTEVDLEVVIPEDKQINKEEKKMGESAFLACQMTVIMTEDKISTMSTRSKRENKEFE